jgi:putative transposase
MINYYHKYEANNFYHIYNHASGDKNLFIYHEDYVDFLDKFEKYFSSIFDVAAYCLMPNHFHFLVKVVDEFHIKDSIKNNIDSKSKQEYLAENIDLNEFIEDQYRRLYSAYAIKYNNKYKTSGQLFQKKHKRILIYDDI